VTFTKGQYYRITTRAWCSPEYTLHKAASVFGKYLRTFEDRGETFIELEGSDKSRKIVAVDSIKTTTEWTSDK